MISLTSPVEIWAHQLPAGAKLGVLCLASIALFALKSPVPLGVAFGLVLCLYLTGGRVFLRAGARSLRPLWPFVVVIAIWHAFSGQIEAGSVVLLRLIAAIALANFVSMTTRLSDMIEVVKRILTPLRIVGVSTRHIELAIALAIRFTPVLSQKGEALNMAWRARASRRARWRLVLPLAVLAIDDAEDVAEALRARGGLLTPTDLQKEPPWNAT